MPTYGIMHDDGTFEPLGQAPQYAPPQGQVAYSAYNQQQQQPRYRQWQGNGYRVNVGQPRYNTTQRYSGNGYAPRGIGASYIPQQEYAYNSYGQLVPIGQRNYQQPVNYEFMPNSRGQFVSTSVYNMNNSAVPVRAGVDPEGRPYGINYQAAFPQQTQRATTRVRNMPQPIPTGVSSAAPMLYNQPQSVQQAFVRNQPQPIPTGVSSAAPMLYNQPQPVQQLTDGWNTLYQPGTYQQYMNSRFAENARRGELQLEGLRNAWNTVRGWLAGNPSNSQNLDNMDRAINESILSNSYGDSGTLAVPDLNSALSDTTNSSKLPSTEGVIEGQMRRAINSVILSKAFGEDGSLTVPDLEKSILDAVNSARLPNTEKVTESQIRRAVNASVLADAFEEGGSLSIPDLEKSILDAVNSARLPNTDGSLLKPQ